MKVLSCGFINDLSQIRQWKMVDEIVRTQMPADMMVMWECKGYEGLFLSVPEYFGMSKMYRCKRSHVTYEFTNKQWTMFLLRWS